jgi:eukaryotic-like serine/threonine-protein kinase
MAEVWAADKVGEFGFSRMVAIKMQLEHLLEDPQVGNMFLDEARLLSTLQHPNVCNVLDLGVHEGTPFIALEWIDGIALSRIIGSKAMTLPLAVWIVEECCRGLHAAHQLEADDGVSLDLIHRDVTPHNVLLSRDGTVKVADFGLVRAVGHSHDTTNLGILKGKLAYIPPEVLKQTKVDRRGDIYALGCVLYELCLGRRVFESGPDFEVLTRIAEGNIEKPSVVKPDFPVTLEAIILRALCHRASDRFATAEDMRRDLEAWRRDCGSTTIGSSDLASIVNATAGDELTKRTARIRGLRLQFQSGHTVQGSRIGSEPGEPLTAMTVISTPRGTPVDFVAAPETASPVHHATQPNRPTSKSLPLALGATALALTVVALFFWLRTPGSNAAVSAGARDVGSAAEPAAKSPVVDIGPRLGVGPPSWGEGDNIPVKESPVDAPSAIGTASTGSNGQEVTPLVEAKPVQVRTRPKARPPIAAPAPAPTPPVNLPPAVEPPTPPTVATPPATTTPAVTKPLILPSPYSKTQR